MIVCRLLSGNHLFLLLGEWFGYILLSKYGVALELGFK